MKRKNGAKRFWAILLVSILFTTVGISFGLLIFTAGKKYVKFDAAKLDSPNINTVLMTAAGGPLELGASGRSVRHVRLDDLNPYTADAFIAIEDKRFYRHGGIDGRGVVRAALHNAKKGDFVEGASTISQQLIKNTHLSNTKTIRRKANEMLLALRLERKFSKAEILEKYLNTIYFGNSAYGIERAANIYFHKGADELTLCESAMLAGLIKSPATYSPLNNYEKCIERKNIVLRTMKAQGKISETDFSVAEIERPTVFEDSGSGAGAKYYAETAVNQACAILGVTRSGLLAMGLTIFTYFDIAAQRAADDAVAADTTKTTGSDESAQKLVLIADNLRHSVIGLSGRGVDNFWSLRRQIGSVAKPIAAYAPALELGYITTLSPILDEKTNFGGYMPKNYSDNYAGWVTASDAVARSLNVPAVKALNMVGTDAARKFLKQNGVEISEQDESLAMALGAFYNGASLLQVAQAYATFANGGIFHEISLVNEIRRGGTVLWRHNCEGKRVFGADTAFLMTEMLKGAVDGGTARVMRTKEFDLAAKTGTVGAAGSDGNSDALVCAYTTKHTILAWLGTENGEMAENVTGGGAPAVMGAAVFKKLYAGKSKPRTFEIPQGVIRIAIDKEILDEQNIVLRAAPYSKKQIWASFSLKSAPKDYAPAPVALQPHVKNSGASSVKIGAKNNGNKLQSGGIPNYTTEDLPIKNELTENYYQAKRTESIKPNPIKKQKRNIFKEILRGLY